MGATEPSPEAPDPGASPSPDPDRRLERRRRRWRLLLLLSPLFVLTGLVLVIVELPHIITPDMVRREAVRAITDSLGVPARIDALDYDPLTGISMQGVRIGPPAGFEQDVFSADRVAVRYDLAGVLRRKIRVEEVALDAPRIVIETRNGRSNVDAILEHLAKRYPPRDEPEGPSDPSEGPLLPVDIILDGLSIGPLSVDVVGEGPTGRLSQVWLRLKGEAGRERIDVTATLATRADPPGNLRFARPAQGDVAAIRGVADLGLDVTAKLLADSSSGLVVQKLSVEAGLTPRAEVTLGERALPEARLALRLEAELVPPEDRLTIRRMTSSFAEAPVLEAQAELTGLYRALQDELGSVAGPALAQAIGLPATETVPKLDLSVPHLLLPLDEVSPFAELFEPGAKLRGRVGVRGLEVVGPVAGLKDGLPEVARGKIAFNGALVDLPRQQLRAGPMDGEIDLLRAEEEEAFDLRGAVSLGALRSSGISATSGAIEVDGRVPKLGYPLPGPVALGISVALTGVRGPGIAVDRMNARARIEGTDLLGEDRAGAEPLDVRLDLTTEGVSAQTGTTAPYRLDRAEVVMSLQPDHLVTPAKGLIPVQLEVKVPSASGPSGLEVKRAQLAASLTLEDPRRRYPFDVSADLDFQAQKLAYGPYDINALKSELQVSAPGDAAYGRGPLAGVRLPAWIKTKAKVSIGSLVGRAQMAGLDTPLSLDWQGRFRPAAGAGRVGRFRLDLPDALRLSGSAQVRRGLSKSPWVSTKVALDHAHLGPLAGRLPKAYLAGFEDAVATGTARARVNFEGALSDMDAAMDLRAAPIELEAELDLEGVGVRSERGQLAMEGLTGRSEIKLEPSGARLDNQLTMDRFELTQDGLRRAVIGTQMRQHLGYVDGEWQAESNIDVERLAGALEQRGDVEGLSSSVLIRYPTGGDVELSRMIIRAGSAGVEAWAEGRLARGPFGVFTPRFELDGRVDFDRLRALWPEIGQLSGTIAAAAKVTPDGPEQVRLRGNLEMIGFDYDDGRLSIEDASGRVPLEQSLRLPVPRFDREVAEAVGHLGDDLEARGQQLWARLQQAQGYVELSDVILVPPRHADHEALRPYRRARGPDLRIGRIRYDRYELESVIAEALWQGGVLRLDHFEAALWDGDVLVNLALQVTAELDVRARIRGTVTNLNLDIPYAMALKRAVATDPAERDKYTTSATLDLSFALQERSLNGRMEISKLSQALVERLFGGLELSGGGGALRALSMSERVGVRPVAAKVWISQNLLNVQFDWRRLWLHVYYDSWAPWWIVIDTALIFARPAVIPTLGGLYVIPTVNGAIHRLSLSGFLEQVLDAQQPEARLRVLAPHVRPDFDDP